jgi:hypothetical protein
MCGKCVDLHELEECNVSNTLYLNGVWMASTAPDLPRKTQKLKAELWQSPLFNSTV